MLPVPAHQKFMLLVQTAAMIKDLQVSQSKAVYVVACAMDIDDISFKDYEEDMESLAGMAVEYVNWQYGEVKRPSWITFYNGKFA